MALSQGRNTKRREGVQVSHPVGASRTIYAGSMVTLLASGGWAVPAGTASAGNAVGVAEETVVNAGSNGDQAVRTRIGCYQFKNSTSGDLIARADIGKPCFIVDDETVAKTDGSSTRMVAGRIADVDAAGVWVEVGAHSITVNITNEA